MNIKKELNLKLLSVLVCLSLILSIVVVWINIKVIDLSYTLSHLEKELKIQKELREKLIVEFSNITSEKHLLDLAQKYNLMVADPTKVRRIKIKF